MSDTILFQIADNFYHELKDASKGEQTSLPFLVSQLPQKPLVNEDEIFQVMVLGGSIFKSALATYEKGSITFAHEVIKKQPTFATKEQFLYFITQHLDDDISILALNFAQPIQPIFSHNKLDGIFIKGSKGSRFDGLEGEIIGKEIEQYISQRRRRSISVSVSNDTICLLLSGLSEYPKEDIAGGILGTGLNFTFFLDKDHAVNLEAASFDNFAQSEEGETIDRTSTIPGFHLFEKEVAGAYLFKRFNLLIKKQQITFDPIQSTEELTHIAENGPKAAKELARDVFIYSASLVACQIAGIVKFKHQDLTFIMQGSLFWSGYRYSDHVEKIVKLLVYDYSVRFVNVKNSDILGGAKLVA